MPFYGMAFAQVFCQVHFMCFASLLCQVMKSTLLFCHVDFAVLPTPLLPFCKVHIAKFSTQHSQVANATLLFCSLAIFSNCPAYFTLWAAQN
jgi:hypothetical protein